VSELRQRQPRQKDAKYLDYIRSLPCTICGDDTTTEAAHLRTANIALGKDDHGWGRPSDKWALPLCGAHHREQHTMNELKFWANYGIDPFIEAMKLRSP
jgi:hypothetical protein